MNAEEKRSRHISTRKIYLEPMWKLPISAKYIASSPPDGYEFIRADDSGNRVFLAASRRSISYSLLRALDRGIPTVVFSSWLRRWRKPPQGAALTYAFPGHLVLRKEPWVVSMEYPGMLLGNGIKHLMRHRGLLERAFSSPYCRKVLCEYEAARRALVTTVDCAAFRDKIEIVLPAPPPLPGFARPDKSDRVRLFTLGSGNIMGEYLTRGIREAIETFIILRRDYPSLELVIRSDMPPEDRRRYEGAPGLRIIDHVIPRSQLEQEFASADIFLLPSHGTYPYTLMEAMSYRLPVVALGAWANAEFVEDGRTGFVVQPSVNVPYFYRDTAHPNFGSAEFRKAISIPDPRVIGDLVRKVRALIDDAALRKTYGDAGRQAVESGRLSRPARNEKLKRVLDEAIGQGG